MNVILDIHLQDQERIRKTKTGYVKHILIKINLFIDIFYAQTFNVQGVPKNNFFLRRRLLSSKCDPAYSRHSFKRRAKFLNTARHFV